MDESTLASFYQLTFQNQQLGIGDPALASSSSSSSSSSSPSSSSFFSSITPYTTALDDVPTFNTSSLDEDEAALDAAPSSSSSSSSASNAHEAHPSSPSSSTAQAPSSSSSSSSSSDASAASSPPLDAAVAANNTYDLASLAGVAHCRYCGIHSPASIVRCTQCPPAAAAWFCNGRGEANSAHIIHHLVRAKHREVALHPLSPLGETTLECYNCGCKNVFLLGFIPAKSDSVVVLICRTPCLNSGLKDANWDITQWLPLIDDKQFLSWLVKPPTEAESFQARPVSSAAMSKLEEAWKNNPQATLESIMAPAAVVSSEEEEVKPVLISYDDAVHYQNLFGPLVQLEAEYDRRMKESQTQHEITVSWSVAMNRNKIAIFRFNAARQDDQELRLATGDELQLKWTPPTSSDDPLSSRAEWKGQGSVVKIGHFDEITLEMRSSPDTPTDLTTGFSVDYVWKSTSFDRMQKAMKTFAVDQYSVTGYLYHVLLGHRQEEIQSLKLNLPVNIVAPNLPELNLSQAQAVRTVLSRPFSLIQGPPGTGKTVTSATIVYHLAQQNDGQVLVCAPSNVAVDQLTEKIHATGLKVVRLSAKSREAIATSVDFLTLHKLVDSYALQTKGELYKLSLLKEMQGELSAKDAQRYLKLKKTAERSILLNADVICTTLAGCGDPRLSTFRFHHVLIDEATQSSEPECLIAIAKGAKQVVMIGDHCQLGPVILCKKAAQAGLGRSLFERMILLGYQPVRLQVQYRMHPALSLFPSNTFYDGYLQNGVTEEERYDERLATLWPASSSSSSFASSSSSSSSATLAPGAMPIPTFFYCSIGPEEISSSGTSYLNRQEAANIEKLLILMMRSGVKASQIGVITPYEGQRCYLMSLLQHSMKKNVVEELEVASVDSFQGREKDYILLSCVRSNEHQGIGFLHEPRRLNVALTRAKYGVIVMGNAKVLARQPLWNNLLNHYKNIGCLVDGPLTNLKVAHIKLERAKRYLNKRNALLPVNAAFQAQNGLVYPSSSPSNASAASYAASSYSEFGHANGQHNPMMKEETQRREAINRLSYGFIDDAQMPLPMHYAPSSSSSSVPAAASSSSAPHAASKNHHQAHDSSSSSHDQNRKKGGAPSTSSAPQANGTASNASARAPRKQSNKGSSPASSATPSSAASSASSSSRMTSNHIAASDGQSQLSQSVFGESQLELDDLSFGEVSQSQQSQDASSQHSNVSYRARGR